MYATRIVLILNKLPNVAALMIRQGSKIKDSKIETEKKFNW